MCGALRRRVSRCRKPSSPPTRRSAISASDFAKEITDNRVGSLALSIGFPILIMMLGAAFGLWFGSAPVGIIGALVLAVILMIVGVVQRRSDDFESQRREPKPRPRRTGR